MSRHVAANTGCNLGCTYCYEEPDREMRQEQIDSEYDIDLILEQVETWMGENPREPVGLHGGEPLLLRDEHIEQIFKFVDEHPDNSKGTHIQTNATLISDHHIELFKEYNVHVGISCDGPAELNDERLARSGGEDVTTNMTESTHDSIDRLLDEGVSIGIITVAHETNCGTDEKLEQLLDWFDYLNRNGAYGHYNPAIPYEAVQDDISLSPGRLKEVYLRTWEWMKEEPYRKWDPLGQMQDNILGLQLGNCVNQTCDVFNTKAAQIIKGDGETTGCGKTWESVGDGTPFLQGPSSDNEYEETEERYEMLKQAPGPYTEEVENGEMEDQGGCKGCDYWNVCQGGCPSAGLEYDYRNRTRWCEAKYAAYDQINKDLKSMFRQITTVADLPWDAEIAQAASERRLDFKPFAGIAPSESENPSTWNGEHEFGEPFNRIADDLSFDSVIREYKKKYPSDSLTIDAENNSIHADTRNGDD